MCGVLASDVGVLDTKSDLARGGGGDDGGGGAVGVKSLGGVAVGSYVEGLHPSQLVPFLPRVLVAFDMFPGQWKGRAASQFNYLVDYVVL